MGYIIAELKKFVEDEEYRRWDGDVYYTKGDDIKIPYNIADIIVATIRSHEAHEKCLNDELEVVRDYNRLLRKENSGLRTNK